MILQQLNPQDPWCCYIWQHGSHQYTPNVSIYTIHGSVMGNRTGVSSQNIRFAGQFHVHPELEDQSSYDRPGRTGINFQVPSGNLTYGKWTICRYDLPIKNGDFPQLCQFTRGYFRILRRSWGHQAIQRNFSHNFNGSPGFKQQLCTITVIVRYHL